MLRAAGTGFPPRCRGNAARGQQGNAGLKLTNLTGLRGDLQARVSPSPGGESDTEKTWWMGEEGGEGRESGECREVDAATWARNARALVSALER